MATRTVRRSGAQATGVEPISARLIQFLTLTKNSADMKARADLLKKDLASHADAHGTVDEEKGHRVFLLPTGPVDVGGKRYSGFMRQKRVPQPAFNEERAQELCEAKGFEKDQYISIQEYVDQDKVYRLYADDLLTDEEMKSLLDQADPTYAFVPMKES